MFKIGMVSLGCPKNRVDAEIMLKKLQTAGFEIVPEEAEADAIIVNTCGFIEDAKAEAIENIIETAKYKKDGKLKALIVTGCLAERYRDEIKQELPEVDVVVSLAHNADIVEIVNDALNGKTDSRFGNNEDLVLEGDRLLTTPPYTAYVKIAEGCDNHCTYCAIPAIRGKFRSRDMADILFEVGHLVDGGVKEIVLVAQDTTRYGEDIYGAPQLASLISNICKIPALHWVRVLYTYPDLITNELLQVMATEKKFVKYLDIPLQHCNAEVLKRMNRKGDRESLKALIERIRILIPDVTLRTTLITGFPGETEQQFEELAEFVKEAKFDRLGCFAYSEEEGTPAALLPDQIEQQTRVDRAEAIMNDQLSIAIAKNEAKYDTVQEVLIEGYDDYIKCYFGRTAADAPEIDGKVFFTVTEPQEIGTFVNVRIIDSLEYDLLGEMVE